MNKRSLLVGFASLGGLLLSVAWLASAQGTLPRTPGILGFSISGTEAQRAIEARFLKLPSEKQTEEYHRFLTEKPHVAGSPRDRELAEWTAARWREFGLEDVEIVEHEVLLPWPEEVTIEMAGAPASNQTPWRASMKEDPVPGDPSSVEDIPYHAYSASGEVTAPVVYAASGNPADYDWLASQGIDIKGKIALVRYSVPYSYRGFKALTAQKRGAAGILIYSDPADDGFGKGKTYPAGPWGPESHIQRGGIVYDFMVPGDPLTPGWASVPGARRVTREEAISLPTIMSAPLSYKDARVLLEALGGPEAPQAWKGGLPITYRVGPSKTPVRMRVRSDDRVRPIWTVTGKIRGTTSPDDLIILGNHRDAWVFGGVDPSSGSASMMDLARTLGALARDGARPRRSILFASWDAEEFTLTSSTEWGEQHEQMLRDHAVAYLNVDSSTSGPNFSASAVPSLKELVLQSASVVTDPATRMSIAAATRGRMAAERGTLPTGPTGSTGGGIVSSRLGSGSDYTVFLNFLGVPIVDMSFDGPYGVYHSMYDNHQWVATIGDPGFRYHAAMTRLWGVMALRLANAEVLPLDYRPYATSVAGFLDELQKQWRAARVSAPAGARDATAMFAPARAALTRFTSAAADRGARITGGTTNEGAARVNESLMKAERALLDPAGIPGRPWYRHQIYAPKFTYAPEVLPGLAEAIAAGDASRLREQVAKLAAALDRAAAVLVLP